MMSAVNIVVVVVVVVLDVVVFNKDRWGIG